MSIIININFFISIYMLFKSSTPLSIAFAARSFILSFFFFPPLFLSALYWLRAVHRMRACGTKNQTFERTVNNPAKSFDGRRPPSSSRLTLRVPIRTWRVKSPGIYRPRKLGSLIREVLALGVGFRGNWLSIPVRLTRPFLACHAVSPNRNTLDYLKEKLI